MNSATASVTTVTCKPYTDQRPGTAGLRKKVRVFQQPHYLQTFVQAIFDTLALRAGTTLVVGGDGRYYNDEAIRIILEMAAGNGVTRVIVGQHGILSTPAASNLIRQRGADAGFLLTASHNPGGPDGDFGLKFNMPGGGQAPEAITEAVYERSRRLGSYRTATLPPVDLGRTGEFQVGSMTVEVVDPVDDYLRLMESLFDFDRIGDWLRQGNRVCFDAMHGVTGPYARRILVDTLGCAPDAVLNGNPLPDFGGHHPDPNPVDARHLVEAAMRPGAPALLAASDGDGDRNMILGPGTFVSPGDSVAIMLAHLKRIPGYAGGVPGVARSMPTSRALDTVAQDLGLPCYETPTGWRFFCNLLDADLIGLCGEESFGTSSSHVREKDGLWAVLMWLNLLAVLDMPVGEVVQAHWQRYGRHHYQRRDYFVADGARARELMKALTDLLPSLRGSNPAGGVIQTADEFSYRDPVDGSLSEHQGVRLVMSDGSRIVYRLSGTDTAGATLRVYLERHLTTPEGIALSTDAALDQLGTLAAQLARIRHYTGLDAPSARI